ncbi:carboxymuconolactone decarboxylase family protein [Hyphococcus sp.]|uniref:carboxymuconolactone decarboxylase family protein n=1 Tax=Hyphococcus sp. TaxID=2038636 RepID=UPI00207D73CA|nr:MAG: alkyl hydroperoxide reductase AhpD [Marinicaulis sp.]
MALFPSLPETPHLADVYRRFPEHVKPILIYHDLLLRGESPLTIGERELIAAYVSGLNACKFCFGAHKLYAELFGFDPVMIEKMVANLYTAPVEEKLKPLLRYAGKLITLPPELTEADAKAVYDAGWSERALFDTIQISALFSYMNRIIEGTGVAYDHEKHPLTEDEKNERRERTYADFGKVLGIQ